MSKWVVLSLEVRCDINGRTKKTSKEWNGEQTGEEAKGMGVVEENNKQRGSSNGGGIQSKNYKWVVRGPERIGVVEAPRVASEDVLTAESTGQEAGSSEKAWGSKKGPVVWKYRGCWKR